MWDVATGNVDGYSIGKSTEKLSFFDTPTSPQRTNPMQAMVQGTNLGTIVNNVANVGALANAVNNTCGQANVTVTGLLTTDFILSVTKPTANAGMGIAGFYANAANTLAINLCNPTAANVVPTANEVYVVTAIRGMNTIAAPLTPANVANGTSEQIFTLMASNATATPVVNAAGQLVGANMTSGGTLYVAPPTVVFSTSNTAGPLLPYPNIETGTISGSGAASGFGQYPYPGGPPTSVSALLGNTVLPTAVAVVANGAVTGIEVLYAGLNLPTSGLTMSFIGGNTVAPGMLAQVNPPSLQAGLGYGNCRVVGNNQVAVEFVNLTANAITPANGTYTFFAFNEMPPLTPVVTVSANLAAPANTAANATAAQAVAMPGLTTLDVMIGVAPPATAANTIIVPGVSAANSANFIQFSGTIAANSGAGLYNMAFYRPAAPTPAMNYQLFLTPTAVAANTTAEQVFTLSANLLTANMACLVNKLSFTNGISIVNARANAANQLAITYMNTTANAITPPAEPYLIGNFPALLPTIGANLTYGYCTQSCGLTWNQVIDLQNELQQTLVQKSFIVGA